MEATPTSANEYTVIWRLGQLTDKTGAFRALHLPQQASSAYK